MNKMLLSTFIVKTNKWWKWLYSFLPVDEKIMTTLFFLWILSINDVLILSLFLAMYFTILGKIFWPSILIIFYYLVNPIQDGLFRNCSRMGGGLFAHPLPKICRTYPAMMKLGTVIPYLRKTQKMYKSRETTLSSAGINIFSPEISKFCYIKKYRYRLEFDI